MQTSDDFSKSIALDATSSSGLTLSAKTDLLYFSASQPTGHERFCHKLKIFLEKIINYKAEIVL